METDEYGNTWWSDGTMTDTEGYVWENGVNIGYDYGDGTWQDNDGYVYDDYNNVIAWGDPNEWYTGGSGGGGDDSIYTLPVYNVGTDIGYTNEEIADMIPTGTGEENSGGGFWSSVGGFLSSIFGGSSGGGGGGGGGGMVSSGGGGGGGAQQPNAQQLQQQLAQAYRDGASAATIATLQAQLRETSQPSMLQPILIAGAVGLGVYVLASSRQRNPSRLRNPARRRRTRTASRRS